MLANTRPRGAYPCDDAAEGQGHVSPRLLRHRVTRARLPYRVVDISGHNFYGYAYVLRDAAGRDVATTHDVSFPRVRNAIGGTGAYSPMFTLADLPVGLRLARPGEREQ